MTTSATSHITWATVDDMQGNVKLNNQRKSLLLKMTQQGLTSGMVTHPDSLTGSVDFVDTTSAEYYVNQIQTWAQISSCTITTCSITLSTL